MLIMCVRDSVRVCVRVRECVLGVRGHQHEHARARPFAKLRMASTESGAATLCVCISMFVLVGRVCIEPCAGE